MYKVSKDYGRFRELLDQGHQLVCFADYRPIYDRMERLVVKAQRIDYDNGQRYWYRVATHGIGSQLGGEFDRTGTPAEHSRFHEGRPRSHYGGGKYGTGVATGI